MIQIKVSYINNFARLELGYDVLNQNITTNKTTVRFYLLLHLSSFVSWSRGKAQVWNKTVNLSTSYQKGVHTLVYDDVELNHNESGEFSGFATSSLSTTFINGSCSGYFSLPKIPRQANLVEASNFNDEENPVIKYQNPLGDRVEVLQACVSLNGDNDDIKYRDISKTGNNYTFNLTEDEKNILRNATTNNSRIITFFIQTAINGVYYYSTLKRTFSVVNASPIFTDFSYKDVNEKTTSLTGDNQFLIEGYSKVEVKIPKMLSQKGATPKNYNLSSGEFNKVLDYSDNEITTSLEKVFSQIKVRAFDSRNNFTEVFKNVMIYPYETPKIYIDIKRKNDFENETILKISGQYDELKINNAVKNTKLIVRYRYKEQNGVFTQWNEFNINKKQGKYNCDNVYLNLDNNKVFEFEIEAEDNLEKVSSTFFLGEGVPAFFISSNKKAIGINCLPSPEAKNGEIWYKTNKLKKVLDYEIKNNVIHFENDYYTKGLQFYTNEPNLIGYYNEYDILNTVLEFNNIEFVANQPKTFQLNLGNLQILDFKVYLYLNGNNRWYVNYDGINNSNITINDTEIEFRPTQSFVFDKMRIILKYFKEG